MDVLSLATRVQLPPPRRGDVAPGAAGGVGAYRAMGVCHHHRRLWITTREGERETDRERRDERGEEGTWGLGSSGGSLGTFGLGSLGGCEESRRMPELTIFSASRYTTL